MPRHVIDHPHNEASAIIAVHNRRLLDAFGFDTAFWIASDEERAHKAVALLGRRRAPAGTTAGDASSTNGGWQVVDARWKRRARGDDDDAKDTDDVEAMARAGAFIYVFGSQFGAKDGPLQPQRHFVARFNEALVAEKNERVKGRIEVARAPFLLHRVINDALAQRHVRVRAEGERVRRDVVRAALVEEGVEEGAKEEGARDAQARDGLLRASDHAINVEGACFLPNGRLLLGLRWPVTEDGHPILVELDGIDRLFVRDGAERFGAPEATRVIVIEDAGTRDAPAGVRELDQRGRTIHAITGDLDHGEDSAVLADQPGGARAPNEHRVFGVPGRDGEERGVGVARVRSRLVRRFGPDDNVEGFALFEDDTCWYVHDDERVVLDEVPAEDADAPPQARSDAPSRDRARARKKRTPATRRAGGAKRRRAAP